MAEPETQRGPEITGATKRPVRVAVAQIAFHPAVHGSLVDPLGRADPEGKVATSLLPPDLGAPPEALREKHEALSSRIRDAYLDQTTKKLRCLVDQCRSWGVRLLVLPEYSVPAQVLRAVAEAAGPYMVVVAGSCFVDNNVRRRRWHEDLGGERPGLRQNVASVLLDSRLIATIAKTHATPEEQRMELASAAGWGPVVLPGEAGGSLSLGVLICLDFVKRDDDLPGQGPEGRGAVPEPHRAPEPRFGPRLNECRLLAVPALTPETSLPLFQGHHIEESGPGRRPVLFANWAPGGGSTIVVGERQWDEVKAFPTHAGVLSANEEGVLIADVDLAVVGVGKGGRYGEALPCKPFAAASFVYTASEPSLAAWVSALHEQLPETLGERDEADVLDGAVAWIQAHPPPRAPTTPMRELRWNRMHQTLENESSAEALRRLTREVVFPPDVLPLAGLEQALCRGAGKTLQTWIVGGQEGSAAFATAVAMLNERADRGEKERQTWHDVGRRTWADVVDRIAGSKGTPIPGLVSTPLDRSTERVESAIVARALAEGDERFRAGHFEEALTSYQKALREARHQGADNEIFGDRWKVWAARAAMKCAAAAANLQDIDGARAFLEQAEIAQPEAAGRIRCAELWLAIGDVERSKATLPDLSLLEEDDAGAARRALQAIDITEGRIPDDDNIAPRNRLLVATALLEKGDLARSARLCEALLTEAELPHITRMEALRCLLWTVLRTLDETSPLQIAIPTTDMARAVALIEANAGPLLRVDAPEVVRKLLVRTWREFLQKTNDMDAVASLGAPADADRSEEASEQEASAANAVQAAGRLAEAGNWQAALQVLPPDPHPWHRH